MNELQVWSATALPRMQSTDRNCNALYDKKYECPFLHTKPCAFILCFNIFIKKKKIQNNTNSRVNDIGENNICQQFCQVGHKPATENQVQSQFTIKINKVTKVTTWQKKTMPRV